MKTRAEKNAWQQAWKLRNPEKVIASRKACLKANAARNKEWRENNRERTRALSLKYYYEKRGQYIELMRRRQERIRNIDNLSAADKAEIQGLYDFCGIFSGFEVDHMIPLNGKTVSGLHVPGNLQVLSMTMNRRKSNSYTGEG